MARLTAEYRRWIKMSETGKVLWNILQIRREFPSSGGRKER